MIDAPHCVGIRHRHLLARRLGFSHYSRNVEWETSWIRNGLNEQLEKSGWPMLTPQEIKGILSDNAKRLLKIV